MNTQTQNTKIFKSELLTEIADKIKAAGMEVFYSEWEYSPGKPTYFLFTDGVNIGYCQEGYFGGIRFSTVHKPSAQAGTGFGLQDDPGLYEPTIEDAKKAFINTPTWFRKRKFTPIKYANWDEYTQKNNSSKYIKY